MNDDDIDLEMMAEMADTGFDPHSPETEADERRRIDELGRARLAADVLENPLVKQFFRDMEAQLWTQFRKTPHSKPQHLAHLRAMTGMLDSFRRYLTKHVETGQLAKEQLKELQVRRTLWQRWSGQ